MEEVNKNKEKLKKMAQFGFLLVAVFVIIQTLSTQQGAPKLMKKYFNILFFRKIRRKIESKEMKKKIQVEKAIVIEDSVMVTELVLSSHSSTANFCVNLFFVFLDF